MFHSHDTIIVTQYSDNTFILSSNRLDINGITEPYQIIYSTLKMKGESDSAIIDYTSISNMTYKIETQADWIHIKQSAKSGNSYFEIYADSNKTGSIRNAKISVYNSSGFSIVGTSVSKWEINVIQNFLPNVIPTPTSIELIGCNVVMYPNPTSSEIIIERKDYPVPTSFYL